MNRRRFLYSVSALPLVAPLKASSGRPAVHYRLAPDAIHVLRGEQIIDSVSTARPAVLVRHPTSPVLFVVNDVAEHEGLPTGTVETYALGSGGARLDLLRRQSLALSAVNPRHAALSRDARYLVVASQNVGIYNVLPVSPQGELGPVTQALKILGANHLAPNHLGAGQAMHKLTFDPSGRALRSFRADGTLITQLTFIDGQLRR